MKETMSKGIGFYDALLLLFVAYRLAGVIEWPWYQVIGLPFVLVFVHALVLMICALLTSTD